MRDGTPAKAPVRVAVCVPPDEAPHVRAAVRRGAARGRDRRRAAKSRAGADYVVAGFRDEALFEQQRAMKAVFAFGAGVNARAARCRRLPRDVPLIRLEDAGMAGQMVRYVLATVLRVRGRFDVYARQQRERVWSSTIRVRRRRFGVGVLGIGVIGGAIAQALAALGFRVRGSRAHGEIAAGRRVLRRRRRRFDAFLDRPRRPRRRRAAHAGNARDLLDRRRSRGWPHGAHVDQRRPRRARRRRRPDRAARLRQARGRDARRVRDEPLPPAHPFWHHRADVTRDAARFGGRRCPTSGRADRREDPASRAWPAGERRRRSRARLLNAMIAAIELPPRAPGRRRPARRPAEREGEVPTDVKVALIDRLDRRRLSGDRGDGVRVAEVGAADGRRRRRDGAHRAQGRRALSGADAEPQGLRGRARRACRRSRRLRRGERDVLAQEHQLLDRREPRARASGVRRGEGRAACACAATSRACSAARTRATSTRARWSTSPPRCTRWARTKSRSATRSAPARRARRRRSSRASPSACPSTALAGHFHDTYGQALANVYAALKPASRRSTARSPASAAVRTRRARPATSRARTSLYLLDGLGIETGVDMTKLRARRPVHLRFPRPAAGVAGGARARRQGSAAA